MKMLLLTALLILTAIFTQSCSGIRGMRVQVQRPAAITIQKDISTVAILNHSVPAAKSSVESVLSGERPVQDKELSEECIRGLNELLQTSNRFQVKRCTGAWDASDPQSLDFGTLMSWDETDSLCKAYSSDALLVLEYFDTDYSVINPAATAVAAVEGMLNGSQVTVTGKATSRAGFRIYYPATKTVVYQDHFLWNQSWSQSSANPADAIAKLIRKSQALMNVSYATGEQFAMSIIPLYYWEDREMYKGRKGEMERGERQALAKDWEAAIETWKNVYNTSSKSKTRAKAAFNTALGLEVMGNLEEAAKWAQTAYVEGGKSTALTYSSILDQRIREQTRLQQQLEGQ